eukprot:TRINITY_DN16607_c0_g1_i2.p1 TRINITY_DN16607_c0_g1~~TRINITY_DN16607_c0_g1_i2.p1  ORF type:complete len:121 (-),score=21.07 TRINITY_DN16607_c0_g1_i2:519-881(-)
MTATNTVTGPARARGRARGCGCGCGEWKVNVEQFGSPLLESKYRKDLESPHPHHCHTKTVKLEGSLRVKQQCSCAAQDTKFTLKMVYKADSLILYETVKGNCVEQEEGFLLQGRWFGLVS